MIVSIMINYLLAVLIGKNCGSNISKLYLTIAVAVNIGILFTFKYLDFSIKIVNKLFGKELPLKGIALPIGISFFTFQALSYVIDVYRGTVKVQKNPLYVALYISFFPQLIAGPIVRYSTIESQILHRDCNLEMISEGAKRFMLGFGKKVILANNLALVVNNTFGCEDFTKANALYLWLGSLCFSLQIYYDFSGYSDMAIGLGKMFGFKFEENFNHPYIAKSVTDFWRRWHISLSQWFRDYVYIPLGGGRCPWYRHIFNLFIVWMLTGIWHGADYTFIVWGLGYFIILLIEKYFVKPDTKKSIVFKVFWRIITLVSVNILWVMFNSKSLHHGIYYIKGMLGLYGNSFSFNEDIMYDLRQYGCFMVLALLFATPIAKVIGNKVLTIKNEKVKKTINVAMPIIYGLAFLWGVSFLILGAHNPFIYFNF